MASEVEERLGLEIELLESMYPDQVTYNHKARELSYATESGSLKLRLPDGYLVDTLPDVLSANAGKTDLRNDMKKTITEQSPGEECIDSILTSFNELIDSTAAQANAQKETASTASGSAEDSSKKATILIYLHHLLNTNKRKHCLSPPSGVSGVTKPGYPGVLIYSGPSSAVHEHVNELKGLNWAAFQVRLESDDEWKFKHGEGMVEVEGMGDLVAEVDVQEGRKEEFLGTMRMK